MARWVLSAEGSNVNLDQCIEIYTNENDMYAIDLNGKPYKIFLDDAIISTDVVLPANSGFYILTYFPDDKKRWSDEPIIAWAIDGERNYVFPITTEGGIVTLTATTS